VRAWVRVLAVHKRGLAAIRDDLEREMTLPRFDLLANLSRSDGQTLASLSRSMLVTAGNLTGLVDRAARDGLVERRSDPSDRRAWRVHLTPKGARAFHEAERRHATKVARVFASLTPAEMETLVALLDKVKATLREPEPGASSLRRGLSGRKATARTARTARRFAGAFPTDEKKKRTP
jgi:DNA-binding MarR family transcriptional regulator